MSNLQMTITNWGEVVLDKRELKKLMRSAGNDIKSKTARLINQSAGGGRTYRGGGGSQYRGAYSATPYTASAPGEAPVRVSGTLRSALKTYVYPTGEGFAVRDRQYYALFLEAGAHGGGNRFGGRPQAAAAARAQRKRRRAKGVYTARILAPRPFLDRVMDQEAENLLTRTGKALRDGMTWKQTKGTAKR